MLGKLALSAIPMAYKVIAMGSVLTVLFGWWQYHNYKERQKGAKAALEQATKDTDNDISKLKSDAEIGALDFAACDGDGVQWNFPDSKCERKEAGQ